MAANATRYVLTDQTTDACPKALRPRADDLTTMALALKRYAEDVAAEYGGDGDTFRVASCPSDRNPGEIAMHFRNSLPEAPGALAYHMSTNGVPDIEIGCSLFDETSLFHGQESMLCGVSHEYAEAKVDPGGNQWADRRDASGMSDAKEACDFVQNTSYDVNVATPHTATQTTKCTFSNFVLQSFWIPESAGPWDRLGVMKAQYDVTNGYGIQEVTPGSTSQIGGKRAALARAEVGAHVVGVIAEKVQARKRHAYSRTRRRGWVPPKATLPPPPYSPTGDAP